MKKEVKENRVLFRISPTMLRQLDELSEKLKLKRPQVIRFGIDELIAKHTHPGHKGDLTILDTKFLNTILTNLGNRIFELENPEEGKYQEAIEAGKEVDRLLKEGKRAEADKFLREREKKGKYTSSGFVWPESKEKLSPEEREKMLDERYPDRKKQ